MARQLELRTLDSTSFAPYGDVLTLTDPDPERLQHGRNEFRIISRSEDPTGWQLAVQAVRVREITQLGCHPTTRESFEPMSGVAVICVAPYDNPNAVEAFVLDQPVCIEKGIWHATLALTREAMIKIAENIEVTSESHRLPEPLQPVLVAR